MDINRLKEVMASAGRGPNEMEPEFAKHVAQAIAQSIGPSEIQVVSKMEAGSPMLADYLRSKAPELDTILTNAEAQKIKTTPHPSRRSMNPS